MEQILAPVVFNRHLTGDYWLIEIEAPDIAAALEPGQFVNIRIQNSLAPYLRRPFSVYRVSPDKRRLQVAYKIVGEGTLLMRDTMPTGGRCDVIGPLGKGFSLPSRAKRIAVVGRGIGIAALPTLVDAAAERGIEVHAFLSARTRDNLVAEDIFAHYGFPVHAHTDQDSPGTLVTDPLEELSRTQKIDAFYVCGSNRLARVVHGLAEAQNAPAEIAMEQHMACGFGDCHGCVINVKLDADGPEETVWKEVCHYGPVFNTWEVLHA
ncbi:dihydroorotate dehydrogenase electron transfer subunit [Pusillimonas sp.]|uniref:dihydroorotate dehydrogenase electron transfer subunit n=1 Tax=Pusillimonas sp. TaxID=3040095 RepID=UPI0037C93601